MQEALTNGLSTIADFVPKLVLFLVILLVGLLIARLIAKGLSMVLRRLGFDRLVERGGLKQMLAKSSVDPTEIIVKVVYYAIVLLVLQFAFGVFGPNPISALLTTIVAFLPKVVVALVIVVVTAAIANAVRGLVGGTLSGASYGRVLGTVTYVAILALGVIAALNQVDIAVTVTTPVLISVLATVAGIAIVGIGGGLIGPMSRRWEGYLSRAETEADKRQVSDSQY
ncbi:hypothetical protein [Sinomonas sp. ASV322]|uniref:mechanosensitive ion channel family protein n=1 Tax=Sinomonas sp. ASV322 TaxID=3041920 RepID=UPI0027DB43EF|nr:hypothetical protein [Sinomonas sp. ASV322]MDQ4501550.1 hypothetical protein [Sinomonas sp. ASV322]